MGRYIVRSHAFDDADAERPGRDADRDRPRDRDHERDGPSALAGLAVQEKKAPRHRRGARSVAPSAGDEAEARAAGHRHARLAQLVRDELTALLRDEATDPALDGVRVTSLELSVDYRNARVRFTARDPARAEPALVRAAAFLRARLCEAFATKHSPQLRFVHDRDARDDDAAPS